MLVWAQLEHLLDVLGQHRALFERAGDGHVVARANADVRLHSQLLGTVAEPALRPIAAHAAGFADALAAAAEALERFHAELLAASALEERTGAPSEEGHPRHTTTCDRDARSQP
jgi:hypothetical protein